MEGQVKEAKEQRLIRKRTELNMSSHNQHGHRFTLKTSKYLGLSEENLE